MLAARRNGRRVIGRIVFAPRPLKGRSLDVPGPYGLGSGAKGGNGVSIHRVGRVSVVEPQFCRAPPSGRFAFRVDDDRLPDLCDLPAQGGDNGVKTLQDVFSAAECTTFCRRMAQTKHVSCDSVKMRVSQALKRGQIVPSGDEREVYVRCAGRRPL